MGAGSRAGRIIGVAIVVQMLCGVMVNLVLEAPLFGTPGFLVNAAHYPRQIGLAALLGLITEALWVGIAVTVLPLFYHRSRTMTLWFAALAVVVLAVAVVENAAVMSMVSLSEAYAKASAAERGQFEAIRGVVAAARNWPHFNGPDARRLYDSRVLRPAAPDRIGPAYPCRRRSGRCLAAGDISRDAIVRPRRRIPDASAARVDSVDSSGMAHMERLS